MVALDDPAAVHVGLDRISRAVEDGDYAQAIGSAKELVESTAKLVLRTCGEVVDDKDDLPALVTKAQRALDVHPSSPRPGPDNSDAVKKILGGAMTITNGLADLRNRGYGTGHGPAGPRVASVPATPTSPCQGRDCGASSCSTPWPTRRRPGGTEVVEMASKGRCFFSEVPPR